MFQVGCAWVGIELLQGNGRWSISLARKGASRMSGVIFEVREDAADGGSVAAALGFGIHTQAETVDALRARGKDAMNAYCDDTMQRPKIIRLHIVKEEAWLHEAAARRGWATVGQASPRIGMCCEPANRLTDSCHDAARWRKPRSDSTCRSREACLQAP